MAGSDPRPVGLWSGIGLIQAKRPERGGLNRQERLRRRGCVAALRCARVAGHLCTYRPGRQRLHTRPKHATRLGNLVSSSDRRMVCTTDRGGSARTPPAALINRLAQPCERDTCPPLHPGRTCESASVRKTLKVRNGGHARPNFRNSLGAQRVCKIVPFSSSPVFPTPQAVRSGPSIISCLHALVARPATCRF